MPMIKLLLSVLLFLSTLNLRAQVPSVSYDFDSPTLVAEMPDELAEISGLGVATDHGNELLAVQDELGKFYRLNAATGQVLWSIDFWKEGDYEGVEAVGEEIWVVKSTGTLYKISKPGKPDQSVDKFNTDLTGDNDVEGLTYDPKNKRLLLACKRDAKDDGNDKDGRYIYAFDLQSNTLSKDPVFAIQRKAVNDYLANCDKTVGYEKLCRFFSTEEKYDLAPSSLAVHPLTGDLYLTSSVGKILMALSPEGKILDLRRLDKNNFPQPEGLAFAPDGTLFISTEAKGRAKARLYRLAPKGS